MSNLIDKLNGTQSRWRSKLAWTSTLSLIVFIIKHYTDYEIQKIDELVDLILTVLTALGLFNNPTRSDSY